MDSMLFVVFWRLDRRTVAVSMIPRLEMVCSPPDIVYDAGLHMFEAISMPQGLDDCSCSEGMSGSCDFLDVKSSRPRIPVDAFETARTGSDITFSSQILGGNLFAFSVAYLTEDAIGFLELGQAELNLCCAELGVDALLVEGTGIHWVI